MQPGVNKFLVASKNKTKRNDTAFFIFDKANLIPYRVSMTHHRAMNGAMNDPIMNHDGDKLEELSRQMVYIQTPVIGAVDYFMAGASMDITPESMEIMYDRIEDHIDAHMKAMRSNPSYYIGDTFDTFEQMVEFGAAIWPRVKGHKDRNKKPDRNDDPFARMLTGRANFMTMINRNVQAPKVEEKKETFQPCPLVEKLERMKVYYESSQSWRR